MDTSVYAPTADPSDEEADKFYTSLQNSISDIPRSDTMVAIMGDFNAKVGQQFTDGQGKVESMFMATDFCSINDLYIANTYFQQTEINS